MPNSGTDIGSQRDRWAGHGRRRRAKAKQICGLWIVVRTRYLNGWVRMGCLNFPFQPVPGSIPFGPVHGLYCPLPYRAEYRVPFSVHDFSVAFFGLGCVASRHLLWSPCGRPLPLPCPEGGLKTSECDLYSPTTESHNLIPSTSHPHLTPAFLPPVHIAWPTNSLVSSEFLLGNAQCPRNRVAYTFSIRCRSTRKSKTLRHPHI